MLPSRCRIGTASANPSPSSNSTSALPGGRCLSPAGDGAAPLVSRRLAAPQMLAPATKNARVCTARDLRQPHRCMFTAQSVCATVSSRTDLDAQGGLDFLSFRDASSIELVRGWTAPVRRCASDAQEPAGLVGVRRRGPWDSCVFAPPPYHDIRGPPGPWVGHQRFSSGSQASWAGCPLRQEQSHRLDPEG